MDNLIEDIIRDAEAELGFDKSANDKNGAPENPANANGNQDVLSMANSFLQELEQFKQSLAGNAAGNPGAQEGDPNTANTLENPQGTDPNMGATDPNAASSGLTVQTPGGSVVKIAEDEPVNPKIAAMMKLAALRGKKLFSEVQ